MAELREIQMPDAAARAGAGDELPDLEGERMVLNVGPSHPATHGVLRISRAKALARPGWLWNL